MRPHTVSVGCNTLQLCRTVHTFDIREIRLFCLTDDCVGGQPHGNSDGSGWLRQQLNAHPPSQSSPESNDGTVVINSVHRMVTSLQGTNHDKYQCPPRPQQLCTRLPTLEGSIAHGTGPHTAPHATLNCIPILSPIKHLLSPRSTIPIHSAQTRTLVLPTPVRLSRICDACR